MIRDVRAFLGDIVHLGRAMLRSVWRTVRRRRGPGWHDSPLHEIANAGLGRATHRTGPRYGLMAMVSSAILKLRELVHTDKLNHVIRVGTRLDQVQLRNLIGLQRQIFTRNPELAPQDRINLSIRVDDAIDGAARLTDLVALCWLSGRVNNVNLFWDDATLDREIDFCFSVAERNRRSRSPGDLTLQSPDAAILQALESEGQPSAFLALVDGRKRVSDYLKMVAGDCYTVALSLPESADAQIDGDQLTRWVAGLTRVRAAAPHSLFCLLNPISEASAAALPPFIRSVRRDGFTLFEAVAMAQHADAYCGVLDLFGLAALSRRRPGLYFPVDETPRHDWYEPPESPIDEEARIVRLTHLPEPGEIEDLLKELLINSGPHRSLRLPRCEPVPQPEPLRSGTILPDPWPSRFAV